MEPIAPEIVASAIEILSMEGILEDEIERQVGKLVSDPMEARRLIDWIPEAFGMVLISRIGKPILPRTFQAKNARGKWKSFPFTSEPIFAAAFESAQTIYRDGPQAKFENIAFRGSTGNTANKALNAGVSLDGAALSGPALIGIPAEVYLEQKVPIWKRLFSRR